MTKGLRVVSRRLPECWYRETDGTGVGIHLCLDFVEFNISICVWIVFSTHDWGFKCFGKVVEVKRELLLFAVDRALMFDNWRPLGE